MWLILNIPCNQSEGYELVLCSAFGLVQCILLVIVLGGLVLTHSTFGMRKVVHLSFE